MSAPVFARQTSTAASAASLAVANPPGAGVGDWVFVAVNSSAATAFSGATGWTLSGEGGTGHRAAWLSRQLDGGPNDTLNISGGLGSWIAHAWGVRSGLVSGTLHPVTADVNTATPGGGNIASGWVSSGSDAHLWLTSIASVSQVGTTATAPWGGLIQTGGSGSLGLSSVELQSPNGTVPAPLFNMGVAANLRYLFLGVRATGLVSGDANLPVPVASGFVYEPIISGNANLPVPVGAGSVYAAELVSGNADLPVPVASGFVYEPIVRPFLVLQHLLPRALAWRTTVNTALRRYLLGLGRFADDVREFIDLVYLDLFPETTRELDSWAAEFALAPGDEASRRLALAGAWLARGGQSPDYLQSVIHAAGFTTVFVYEWWESIGPFVARDPRDYTQAPIIGEYQCEGTNPWECFDPEPGDPPGAHCDDSLANDPGYLVNLDLTRRPPPPVPNDPSVWPYFLYFAGEAFPELAPVDATRMDELKELLLKICPMQQWLVLMIDPIEPIELAGEGFGSGPMGTVELGV